MNFKKRLTRVESRQRKAEERAVGLCWWLKHSATCFEKTKTALSTVKPRDNRGYLMTGKKKHPGVRAKRMT